MNIKQAIADMCKPVSESELARIKPEFKEVEEYFVEIRKEEIKQQAANANTAIGG